MSTKTTWLTTYFEIWQDVYGAAPTALSGQLAKILKPLEAAHGRALVISQFMAYCRATPIHFVNLAKFSAAFGGWKKGGHVSPAEERRPKPKPLPKDIPEPPMTHAEWRAQVDQLRAELERRTAANAFMPLLQSMLRQAMVNAERVGRGERAFPLRLR